MLLTNLISIKPKGPLIIIRVGLFTSHIASLTVMYFVLSIIKNLDGIIGKLKLKSIHIHFA